MRLKKKIIPRQILRLCLISTENVRSKITSMALVLTIMEQINQISLPLVIQTINMMILQRRVRQFRVEKPNALTRAFNQTKISRYKHANHSHSLKGRNSGKMTQQLLSKVSIYTPSLVIRRNNEIYIINSLCTYINFEKQ